MKTVLLAMAIINFNPSAEKAVDILAYYSRPLLLEECERKKRADNLRQEAFSVHEDAVLICVPIAMLGSQIEKSRR